MIRRGLFFSIIVASCLCCCSRHSAQESSSPDVVVVALPEPERLPEPRARMVWIPDGTFLAGTAPEKLPRAVDEELPGLQIVLHGFYIDQYAFPNEPGAIQTTGLSRDDARAKCEEQGKRLCTELEWERACKGPKSTTYEYGDVFNATDCPASSVVLNPSGSKPKCKSSFDVYDLHGGAFEWTDSAWGRDERPFAVAKGGASEPGEVYARCANSVARAPNSKKSDLGFRCCAGLPNDARVELEVKRSPDGFKAVVSFLPIASAMQKNLPEMLQGLLPADTKTSFLVDRVWQWAPVGNEDLVVGAGCAHPPGDHALCGVVVSRAVGEHFDPIAFVSSGWFPPNVQSDEDRKSFVVHGGEGLGKYSRRVSYVWGRISVAEPDYGGGDLDKKKKKKKKVRKN